MTTLLRLLLAFCLAWPAVLRAADLLTLANGNSLHGKVHRIDQSGMVEVHSELSPKPILLRGEAVRSIKFDVPATGFPGHSELLHLVNGDILPATVRSLDSEQVVVETWYMDKALPVPRRFIDSIEFGVTPQKLVYHGPKELSDWSDNDDWELDEYGRLVCEASGTIARPDLLPRQFILRFRIEWENSPNFRIYFCDDYLQRTGDADRYYFEVNSAGLQLKRQTSEGDRRWYHLASSSRQPDEFPGGGIDVEIRVDRDRRLLYLYLNGEKLGRYPDEIDTFPTGSGIMLQSQAGNELKNIVPLLEVYEWDAVSLLRRTEGHDNPKTDAIVDVNGEHYSGEVLRLESEDGADHIVLDSPFAVTGELFSVGTRQISSLYFKTVGDPPEAATGIRFELRGGGRLQLSSLALDDQSLRANHPLLGELTLAREALQQLFVAAPGEEPTDLDP